MNRVFVIISLCCSTFVWADLSKPSALQQAWIEYRFQSYEAAEKFFDEILSKEMGKNWEQEATMGKGMAAQFDERNIRPKKALAYYQKLLNEDLPNEQRALLLLLIGEAQEGLGDLKEANAAWEKVIQLFPQTLLAEDALLKRTIRNMGELTEERTLEAVRYAEEARQTFVAPSREDPRLAPVLDNLIGTVYFWRGEYDAARGAFIRNVELASPEKMNYSKVAGGLFRVARVSEKFLNDPETAGAYYRKLVLETPNDVRFFFALEKAVQYGALSMEEVDALRVSGISDEIIEELKKKVQAQ